MIKLPLPPSINSYYSQNNAGYRFKTREAKDWEEEAGYILLNQKKFEDKNVIIIYNFYMPNKKSDYDNRLKILNDVLEKQYIIDNDNQIVEAHIYKLIDNDNPRVEISIKETI